MTKPNPLAVTLENMRDHMLWTADEVEASADRKLMTALEASLEQCSQESSLALAIAEYEVRLPCWPAWPIYVIEFGPVREIVSIQYRDTAGDLQTLSETEYRLEVYQRRAMIRFVDGVSLPDLATDFVDRVVIRFAAGFDAYQSESADREIYRMPMHLRQAVFIRAEAIYEAGALDDRALKALNDAADALLSVARVIRG